MNAHILSAFLLCSVALFLSGCGERPQVVVYKQGEYQGKADTPPYAGAAFGGDKAKWEAAMKARNARQNEYLRMKGS